jgi:hypothetical protein
MNEREIKLKLIAERIIKMFKLAFDVKNRYPLILREILEEHNNDENYL